MTDATVDLAALGEPVRERVMQRHEAREVAFQASREAIRAAANGIRAIHRAELDEADRLIATSRDALDRTLDACDDELRYSGFVGDAAKEYAEAAVTRAAVAGRAIPGPDEVGVDDVSWLHGLAETVGELRRSCLDCVRAGRLADAEALLDQMQEILSVLVTIDAPDGITRGLRRSTDAARAITERTRGDLTAAVGQRALRDALDAHREAMERLMPGE